MGGKFIDNDTTFHHANLKIFDASGLPPVYSPNIRIAKNTAQELLSGDELISTLHSAYPNPASDFIYIPGLSDYTGRYSIYDMNGRIVHSGFMTGEHGSPGRFDVSMLESGYYFLYPAGHPGRKSWKFFIGSRH